MGIIHKNNGVINFGEFCPKPDGVTDNSDALQQAVNVAANSGWSAGLYIPPGEYVLDGEIGAVVENVSTSVNIFGAGQGRTVLKPKKDTTVFGFANSNNVRLADISFQGSDNSGGAGNGIVFNGGRNLNVVDCEFYRLGGHCIKANPDSGQPGLQPSLNQPEDITISGNLFHQTFDVAISGISGGWANMVVENNVLRRARAGLLQASASATGLPVWATRIVDNVADQVSTNEWPIITIGGNCYHTEIRGNAMRRVTQSSTIQETLGGWVGLVTDFVGQPGPIEHIGISDNQFSDLESPVATRQGAVILVSQSYGINLLKVADNTFSDMWAAITVDGNDAYNHQVGSISNNVPGAVNGFVISDNTISNVSHGVTQWLSSAANPPGYMRNGRIVDNDIHANISGVTLLGAHVKLDNTYTGQISANDRETILPDSINVESSLGS